MPCNDCDLRILYAGVRGSCKACVRPGAPGARADRPRPARARPHRVLARVQRGLDGDDELRQHRQHLGAAGLQQVFHTLQGPARVTVPPACLPLQVLHVLQGMHGSATRCVRCRERVAGARSASRRLQGSRAAARSWGSQRRARPLPKSGSSRAHAALCQVANTGASTACPTLSIPRKLARAWRWRFTRSSAAGMPGWGEPSPDAARGGRGG